MKWLREEEILVLYLYFEVRRVRVNVSHPMLVELSKFLRRKPASIAMRMGNFVTVDPENPQSGLGNYAKQTENIWDDFSENCSRLDDECKRIRREYKVVFENRQSE